LNRIIALIEGMDIRGLKSAK